MENVRLNFAHVCENAFLSKDGKINIIGDFDNVSVKNLAPGVKFNYSFYVVTNFTVIPNQKYMQEVLLVNLADNSSIVRHEVEQLSPIGKIGLLLKLNVGFPAIGEYKVIIKLDGVVYNELKITVKEQQD